MHTNSASVASAFRRHQRSNLPLACEMQAHVGRWTVEHRESYNSAVPRWQTSGFSPVPLGMRTENWRHQMTRTAFSLSDMWANGRLSLFAITACLFGTSNLEGGLIARYEFNANFTDSDTDDGNNPDITSDGGPAASTSFTFSANGGLHVSGLLPVDPGHYSILIDFSLTNVSGYNKIIDFKDKGDDRGVYVNDGALEFKEANVPSPDTFKGPPAVFTPNTAARLVITRDEPNDQFDGYVNGNRQFQFKDSSNIALFNQSNGTSSNQLMRFFEDDDFVDDPNDKLPSGTVTLIEIYDHALSLSDVGNLGGPALDGPAAVPEPSTYALSLLGIGAYFISRLRMAKVRSSVAQP